MILHLKVLEEDITDSLLHDFRSVVTSSKEHHSDVSGSTNDLTQWVKFEFYGMFEWLFSSIFCCAKEWATESSQHMAHGLLGHSQLCLVLSVTEGNPYYCDSVPR